MADRMTYDKETGARTYHKVNVDGNWNIGSWASFNTPLKNKKFNVGVNRRRYQCTPLLEYRDFYGYKLAVARRI